MAAQDPNSQETLPASTASDGGLKTLGETFGQLIVIEGTKPCATEGCPNLAQRIVILGREIPSLCPTCQDLAEAAQDARDRAEMVAGMMARSGVTPKLLRWSLGTYPQDEHGRAAYLAAREWLQAWAAAADQNEVPNLLLIGNVGSGKSGLAWSIVRHVIEFHSTSARFVNWRVLLADMQAAMHDKTVRVQDALGLDRIPVLCIDDLGSERATDWRREELVNLIERREQNLLPTIVTSNYSLRELALRLGHDDATIGERIVSRLSENAIVVTFEGPDRRVRVRAQAA